MTSTLINAAVTALAHDRLRVLHDAIARKRKVAEGRFRDADAPGAGPRGHSGIRDDDPGFLTVVPVSVAEKQIQELARRALEILEHSARAPAPPGLPRTGGTSRFAFLGSTAYDWPAWRNEHRWVSRAVRRGGNDGHFSQVVAPATAVAFRTGSNAVIGVDAEEAWKARAFAMGMVTSVASNVIVNPLLHGAAIPRDEDPTYISPLLRSRAERALTRHIFRDLSADQLMGWFPDPTHVKDPLLRGYLDALTTEARLADPPGFNEVALVRGRVLDPSVLRNTYYLTRSDTSWGGGWWFLYLFLFSLPVGFALPIASAIDGSNWKAKRFFYKEPPGGAGPGLEGTAQIAMLSSSLATIGPMITNFVLWAKLPEPDNGPFIWALAGNILDALSALFLGLSQLGGDAWPAISWITILFQLVLRIILMVFAIQDPAGFPSRHWWIQTYPMWATFGCVIFAWIINALVDDASSDDNARDKRIVFMVLWGVVLLAVQIGFAAKLDGLSLTAAVIGAKPPALVDLSNLPPSDDPPFELAHLLDESTLWADPAAPPAVAVSELRYPPGSRAILEMHWTLDTDLQVRHDGHRLWFRLGDSGAEQEIVLPPIAFTPAELGAYLAANVTGRPSGTPGPSGGLVCNVMLAGDTPAAAHRLPFPQVVEVTPDFVSVSKDASKPYLLRHARRAQLTTPHGHRGPAVSVAEGWPIAPGPGAGGADGTGVGMAADLATLLALGAASRLHPGADNFPDAPGPNLPLPVRVSRVFRQWNLDERRINEWRMLICGGAQAEPTDAELPRIGAAAAPPAVMAGTETLANAIGWVPAFRAWQRIATDPVEDCMSDRPAPYNPIVRVGAGLDVQPSNQQLTEVMRYLLDLPV